ncbi:hypothetical protein ABZ252_00605 [Streptomyces sp. NPDC006175]|uniref:hypothetical protein n=1 Tax=Streptomyces sp. NPDC006175 TaxID=3154471 RepID=UPI0033B0C967
MPTPRPAAIALATLLCLAAAGCSEADSGAEGRTTGPADKAPPAAQGAYPVTVENCGRDQTFDKALSRIVVMNGASVAEVSTLLALGLGDRIVSNQQTYGMSDARPGTPRRPARAAPPSSVPGRRGHLPTDAGPAACRPQPLAARDP